MNATGHVQSKWRPNDSRGSMNATVHVQNKWRQNGSRAKLKGVTNLAHDPLRSYVHEPQKNEISFLNEKL